jgi:subfamily B ATP-binding cassette protein MsbA
MSMFVVFNMSTVVLIIPFINTLFDKEAPVMKPMPAFELGTIKEWAFTGINNLLASTTPTTALQYLCAMLVISFAFKNIFHYLQTWFMAPAEQGFVRDLRQKLYDHLTELSLSYFTSKKKGMLMSRVVNDVKIVNDSAIAIVNSIFRDPPQLVTYTIFLFIIDWQLTLIVFLLIPVTGLILTRIGNMVKRESHKLQESLADVTSVLDEGLTSMRIIKAFRTESKERQKFRDHNESYFRTYVSIIRRKELASPITETLTVIVVVAILWFMGDSILTGRSDMTKGVFVAYIFAMLQMMQPLKFFGQVFGVVGEGMAGAQRVFEVLDIQPEITDRPGAHPVEAFRQSIEFKDASFRYSEGDQVLDGVNLTIKAGQVVAIVGPSGAGKSTLIDLIPRFYEVTGGSILMDGMDLRDLTIDSLRGLMGMVTQESLLFNASIYENIAYGMPGASMEMVEQAARAANAHEFILDTPLGYETVIGDRGVKLSGGQRQRLCIARAILKNPPILILDEATSALDTESEIAVQSAIENSMRGRTSIVIAHRLSTIQRADIIYVLDSGKVVESGTHLELMERGSGVYRRLYDLQFQV